jgi:hypothetical protein
MFSLALARYVLKAVLRDRLIHLMLVMMVLGAAVALFLGGAATIEQGQYTVALAGTTLRLVAVLGLVVFICFFMRRSFDNREIDYFLATPLTRTKLLFSIACAFMVVAAILTIFISLGMYALSPHVTPGLMIWSASVLVEMMITAMMALFFSIVLKSATVATLCTLGFYSLCRMMGMMIGIVEARLIGDDWDFKFVAPIVKVISVIVPRFDLLAQSAWIVYGKNTDLHLWVLPAEALVFCALFFVCAISDLRRSQF